MTIVTRAIEFWRDDAGAELVEYGVVLVCFAIASIVALHLIDTKANAVVESDETNYTNALVNGY
jgi:Flp pilus assembly pilin Flp